MSKKLKCLDHVQEQLDTRYYKNPAKAGDVTKTLLQGKENLANVYYPWYGIGNQKQLR